MIRIAGKLPLWIRFLGVVCLCACGGGEPKPQSDWDAVLKLWTEDPAAAMVGLQALPEGQEQLMLFDALLDQDPPGVVALCETIELGAVRNRCDRVRKRRHLWDDEQLKKAWKRKSQQQGEEVTPRIAEGPSSFLLNPGIDSTWLPVTYSFSKSRKGLRETLAALDIPCKEPERNVTCVTRFARRQVKKGKLRKAAATCSVLSMASNWGKECYFSGAEYAVHRLGRSGYHDATEFCLMSGEYRERCLVHVVRVLGTWAPGANRLTPRTWSAIEKTEQVLRETWNDKTPEYFEQELNRFWSAAMFVSYQKVEVITGDPLEFVIEEWHPHVRAAAAWRMLELEGDQTRSLGEWSARLEELLEVRTSADKAEQQDEVGRLKEGRLLWPPDHYWTKDGRKDSEIPSIYYLGRSRRTFSDDDQVDSAICILEAAVRQEVTAERLLREAASHPDSLVQWTATRLAKKRDITESSKPEQEMERSP